MVLTKDIQPKGATASADTQPTEAIETIDLPSMPPTDLYSDEPELESDLHLRQIFLLIASLEWLWRDRNDFFVSGNLTVYFSPKQLKSRDFRGPDFLVALNTERRTRKSWTVWEEGGRYPDLIVEILSDSTARVDRTTKKQLYQNIFRTTEYFWFDPNTLEFEGFVLMAGQYEAIEPNESGYLWSRQLRLHLGVYNSQLRYFMAEGTLVPTPQEAATQAQEAATQAQEAATQAQDAATASAQRAERLSQKLREMGIDPDTV
ncbi:MAG: Uma2 family endonuclease [Phormidesmis sp.]